MDADGSTAVGQWWHAAGMARGRRMPADGGVAHPGSASIARSRRARTPAAAADHDSRAGSRPPGGRRRAPRRPARSPQPAAKAAMVCALLASGACPVAAQSCISLATSTACPAFNASSISTDSSLVGLFPFLSSVSDTASFDSGLANYVGRGFAQQRYQDLIGCSGFDSDNTTDYYARYTTSVLCNAMVQNSLRPCGLSGDAARPLCAESCAAYAQSEEEIASSNVCGSAGPNALSQIRADFTNCALPADSLVGSCVPAVENQPDNCGFNSNLASLCSYCAASSPNATDSCCVFANATTRCDGVRLPVIASSSLAAVTVTMTSGAGASATSTNPAGGGAHHGGGGGLSGGQIAGIVVGAVVGALLLLALLVGACLLFRRRRDRSPATSVFNQPATTRQQPPMAVRDAAGDPDAAGLAALPSHRVARMSAIEGPGAFGRPGRGYASIGGDGRKSTSDEQSTPGSHGLLGIARRAKRSGSLSSGEQLAVPGADDTSPSSNNDFTSPESQGQSEQLAFFKDYYSQDEIHSGDLVSTLWAYEPRAGDELALERGDMIKVSGIWDDGWATGVRVKQRAEDWRQQGKLQRDSGMSNGSSSPTALSETEGEVKAFPLVCVCLPQYWHQTVDSEPAEGPRPPGTFPSDHP